MIHIYCTAHVIALLASINARRPDVPPPPRHVMTHRFQTMLRKKATLTIQTEV